MCEATKTDQRRDAIRAALKLLQDAILSRALDSGIHDIYTNGGEHGGMSVYEMENLCEHIDSLEFGGPLTE